MTTLVLTIHFLGVPMMSTADTYVRARIDIRTKKRAVAALAAMGAFYFRRDPSLDVACRR